MEPYFRKSGTVVIVDSLSITNAIGVGTPIYTLSYTDDDPDDIAGLSVSMTSTSIYFTLVSGKIHKIYNYMCAGMLSSDGISLLLIKRSKRISLHIKSFVVLSTKQLAI